MVSISIILLLSSSGVAQQAVVGGSIKGAAVDSMGAVLAHASVRVLEAESNDVVARTIADESGEFQSENLRSGSYIAVVWARAFHAVRLPVVIRGDQINDLGKVRLEFAGCDSPGVMCDYFGTAPPDRTLARGYVEMKTNCGVDLRSGNVYCPDASEITPNSKAIDLRLMKDVGGTYLSPANGATLGVLLPLHDCANAKLSGSRLRVDGFGPGDDLCVGTPDGRLSHVFLVDEVQRNSSSIRLWHVTRKRKP